MGDKVPDDPRPPVDHPQAGSRWMSGVVEGFRKALAGFGTLIEGLQGRMAEAERRMDAFERALQKIENREAVRDESPEEASGDGEG